MSAKYDTDQVSVTPARPRWSTGRTPPLKLSVELKLQRLDLNRYWLATETGSCHTCLPARVAAGHNSPFTCPACRLRSWALTPLHRVPPHQYRTCRWAVDASPVRKESTGPTLITAPTPPKHFNRSVTAASSRSRPRHRRVPGPLAVMSSRWRRRRGEDFAVSSTALSGIEATTESGPRCCTKPRGLHRASGNPTRGCLTMEG